MADPVRFVHSARVPTRREPRTPGLALLGGPPDGPPPEVDAAFAWLFGKSGWGRFVVLGADGSDEYGRYIYGELPPPHPVSVETLIFTSRDAAADPEVVRTIHAADALFLQGGDRWDCVRLWRDPPMQRASNERLAQEIPLGGSSAGLAVLGELLFSARHGSLSASEALADPYDKCVTLERAFVDSLHIAAPYAYLRNVITDSHFHERKGMGRVLAFMARLAQDGWTRAARAIAVDERTAVFVDADGMVTVVDRRDPASPGSACFLQAAGPPQLCRPGAPLAYADVSVYEISAGSVDARFDLGAWRGQGGESYQVSAGQGTVARPILVK